PAPAMPEEARLAMPTQKLGRFDKRDSRRFVNDTFPLGTWLARLFVFGGGLLLTCYGAWEMYGVVNVGQITVLKWGLLILFVANFSWIAIGFTAGLLGFAKLLFVRERHARPTALKTRTAVVMPIYNEAP